LQGFLVQVDIIEMVSDLTYRGSQRCGNRRSDPIGWTARGVLLDEGIELVERLRAWPSKELLGASVSPDERAPEPSVWHNVSGVTPARSGAFTTSI
jgi:hypothetical protein